MSKRKKVRLDWMNHLVGFLGALLGIYIAFRLEDYRENKKEKEKIEIAKQAIRKEIEQNLAIYKENVDKLSKWLEYINFYIKKINKKGEIVAGRNEIALMMRKNQNRFETLKKIRAINDTLNVYSLAPVFDVRPKAGLSTSYWKTAVASGILSSMDYSLINALSQIYDWTEKDIGVSEKELYENLLQISTKTDSIDLGVVISHYDDIVKAYDFKHDKIEGIFLKINWAE